jgi:ubiquinone/menaquinone biosynthesis C-methylase UbiE
MALNEKQVKDEIKERWNSSAILYDNYHGHGVKSDEEAACWKELFNKTLPSKRLKILDVGCGTGEMSLLLAGMGHRVTGIDISEKMLDKASAKAKAMTQGGQTINVKFMVGDAEAPPVKNDSFDAVVTRHVLWTLPEPQKAMKNWVKTLKAGGKVIAIDGRWNDGKVDTRLRRMVHKFLVTIIERCDRSIDKYSPETTARLPHLNGVPPKKTQEYMEQAGLHNVQFSDLSNIVEIQKKHMPFRYRIDYKIAYYAIEGTKGKAVVNGTTDE